MITVTFFLNEGCTQVVDFSNLPKGTNIVRLSQEWANDLHAQNFSIEREKKE
jgi:hypothetical protein